MIFGLYKMNKNKNPFLPKAKKGFLGYILGTLIEVFLPILAQSISHIL